MEGISVMSLNPDTEPEIIINPDTREIYIPDELYNIAVTADDNAEMVKIRIPRYFDGNDLSKRECTISFNNAANQRGIYKVRQIAIEEDSLVLNWYISKFITVKAGKINFVVEFKKEIDERGMSYSWSTLPAEMNVMAGLDDKVEIDERDLSLYQSLFAHIQATDLKVATLMCKLEDLYEIKITIELLNNQLSNLKQSIESIENSAAYISDTNQEIILEE